MTRLAVGLATALGAGYAPVAPGTVGSAVGIAIYLLMRHTSAAAQIAAVVLISVVGVWAADRTAAHVGKKDPGIVVIDEVAGQLLTLLLLGIGWVGVIAGFLVFRVLDVFKPFPARRFERLPGGAGIMADDLMVGAYGWLLLYGTTRLWPGLL